MVSTLVSIPGYCITEELYNGSRTLVYRGYREADSLPVVIKLLKNPYPSFSELLSFRNQYTITKNLNSPLIVQTYSLQAYQNGYALVMEDFGGISLNDWRVRGTQQSISIKEFLEIAIALCNTLDILYRERIIHKDIKPANILINPETKQVKLIDFSIASLLPRETQTLVNPNVLEGTLSYISPEQTGRMNRGIDYRTDFYSLGVTFYELLTGELPFKSNDPMELVHCHIAKLPPLLGNREKIPQVICDIVMKLIAKNAESRYQSALGLKFDLENCLHQLHVSGTIKGFEIASRDVCDRFIIPDQLYGRESEVSTLLQAFERVSLGATEMMLVAGFSGIGKTAVVNEVHKPIVRQRGYFIKGKYDQFQRNIPFSAFVQAFRDLMGQLLSESDAQIQQWKNKILSAVGENGQVIIEVIPELSRIIGEQPPAIELSGTAAQNRFNLLFQKFTQVFTSFEHPLVMFLDDLQWADSASLKLMQLLMADTSYLLLMGAYRDNEVNPAHPLMLTLSDIQKALFTINTINLAALSQLTVNQLVADTLKSTKRLVLPLSQLVYQKTQGNPFFATQFLKALHQDNLIKFDFELACWQCDVTQVRSLALTDDVVEFMAQQLQKLPDITQDILKLVACIGNQFDLATLAIVSEKSETQTASDLWKALQEGFIIPINEVYKFYQGSSLVISHLQMTNDKGQMTGYKFLHDRVQQAAYSLIPDNQKQAIHLQIGQLLQDKLSQSEQADKLFDIVGHLNQGRALLTQPSDRQQLAQLNLKAGGKARSATAYTAARIYLQTGIELLQLDSWETQYELTLNLYVAKAEASYLNGDLESMEQLAALVLQQARTILDKVKIYEIQIASHQASSRMLEGIAVGKEALAQLGVEFPTDVDEATIGQALQALKEQQSGREIAELIDLPVMSDRTAQSAMQILRVLFGPVFFGMPGLLPLLSATMVRLSLSFGNAPAATIGYGVHGLVLCAFLGEVKTGYGFGRLALSLLERLNAQSMKSLTLNVFGTFIQHRQEALRATMPTLKDGYTAGMETGDILSAAFNIVCYAGTALFAGVELDTLETEFAAYTAALVQAKQDSAHNHLSAIRQMANHLREPVSQPDRLIGTAYDERVMLPQHQQDNDLSLIAIAYTYKLLLAYSFGNYQAALDNITQVKLYLITISGIVHFPIFHLYAALTLLALFPTQPEAQQAQMLAEAATHQTILHQWAQNAPMNHLHKWYLVEAEKHRVLGEKVAATECYDQAIALAKKHQFINEEALANELAAKFYLDWGKERIATEYTIQAYYCYAHWGAKAKVADLEKRYPYLLAPILQQTRTTFSVNETVFGLGTVTSTSSSSSSVSDSLDLAAILKASQTISSEIELSKLLSSLLSLVIENAGAEKCVLMLLRDERLLIKGSMTVGTEPVVLQRLLLEDSQEIPHKLIYKVLHNRQTIVLTDAIADPTLANDPYIIRQQPKSILCSPILHQGKLIGILYLENNLATGAFTSDRVELLNLLCAQAAISLENARLYERSQNYAQQLEESFAESQQKSEDLQQALQDLQQAQLQMVQSEKMSALGNLVAGVAHEMNNPLGFIAASLKQAKPTFTDIIEHLKLYQSSLPNKNDEIIDHAESIDLDYSLEDFPKMIDSMSMACDRLKNISTSLRTFSRADQDYKVPFNIHQGIDSTILILKHRLKANEQRPAIEVITNYGDLPQVECFPGQLNQVFMNLLANAIDALYESNHGRSFEEIKANPNCITITTSVENNLVKIAIFDNGKGMDEQVKSKIFDHLFTTKAVGKGTGLGLAIAKSIIVEKHGGTLAVNSTPGVVTEFVITLPILVQAQS
ncbi:serine/threonine protein kinase [Nostoc sp. 'Peltigera membranacea cyanobiont' 213]|uniref:trifunctional serine/threonine-protein kinase/ATP-binding protein/sensor histidine kinase n=1 Tax=Nostoc sp. 'Peltigera membranacea cyanobiont' 213 TaxID=2014530 RepID=UPI000B953150|nr:ATP-binding sensor histidine kinase [Nostoc sp. 'Peltigera membranacea cyanobiont' 213]OYD95854.1 serine/threonine protein kinase [Nostoc sp. 'Peltigera membranacea cyanobiont' 213]